MHQLIVSDHLAACDCGWFAEGNSEKTKWLVEDHIKWNRPASVIYRNNARQGDNDGKRTEDIHD